MAKYVCKKCGELVDEKGVIINLQAGIYGGAEAYCKKCYEEDK